MQKTTRGAKPIRYTQLDSVRGLAAVMVVLHHAVIMTAIGNRLWWEGQPPTGWWQWLAFKTPLILLHQGRSPVYLFFVLSGFVLSLPWMIGKPQTYSTFMIRRFFRIYVPYASSMILSIILLWMIGHPAVPTLSSWYSLIWGHPVDQQSLLNMVMLIDPRNAYMNFPTWTIAWELRISLIFPLLLWPLSRMGRKGLLVSVLALVAMSIPLRHYSADAAEFSRTMLAYSGLFMMGAFLASIASQIQNFRVSSSMVSVVLLVIGLLMLCPRWSSRPLIAMIPIGIGSCLVIAAALRTGWFSRTLQSVVPMWLGRVSFSLYLLHVPIMAAAIGLTHNILPPGLAITLGVSLSFLLAPIFNRLIERPSQQLGRHLGHRLTQDRKTTMAIAK